MAPFKIERYCFTTLRAALHLLTPWAEIGKADLQLELLPRPKLAWCGFFSGYVQASKWPFPLCPLIPSERLHRAALVHCQPPAIISIENRLKWPQEPMTQNYPLQSLSSSWSSTQWPKKKKNSSTKFYWIRAGESHYMNLSLRRNGLYTWQVNKTEKQLVRHQYLNWTVLLTVLVSKHQRTGRDMIPLCI